MLLYVLEPKRRAWESKIEQACEMTFRRRTVKKLLKAFIRNEDGLTIVEYAVAAALITVGVAAAFGALGATVNGVILAVDALI